MRRAMLLALLLLALPACKNEEPAPAGDGAAPVTTPVDATPKLTLSWTQDSPAAPQDMVASAPGHADMRPTADWAANRYTLVVTYDERAKKMKVDFAMAIPESGKPESVTFVYTVNGQMQVHDEPVPR